MNRYFKEVLDAHELIRNWLCNIEAHDEVCEELLARFSPAYSMVTPGRCLTGFHDTKWVFPHSARCTSGFSD
ncbi:Uncharacterized protein conserved in bacteria [Pantoea agglomerans]|uniref:Uncharacterized protein conserved in bacteria n=1 Tax=Enterobacter agglomerans TaxID=549 RepID=A0A379LQS8_ENTAG|nr:Uncharacterized protein conserved in bacteria [Pantoea agglomerans]